MRDIWLRKREEGVDITDDVVFEIELIRQVEINIDYILMLVKKFHDSHMNDKELLVTIRKAVDASPELRSKKALIETFIAGMGDSTEDVMAGWNDFISRQREEDLEDIIKSEKLKPEETRKFLEKAFADGEVKTTGTEITSLMPPVSRFGGGCAGGDRTEKKQTVIDKLRSFFDKYFGVGVQFKAKQEPEQVRYNAFASEDLPMVADGGVAQDNTD